MWWLSVLFAVEMVLLLSSHMVVRWRLRMTDAIMAMLLGPRAIQSLVVHTHTHTGCLVACRRMRLDFKLLSELRGLVSERRSLTTSISRNNFMLGQRRLPSIADFVPGSVMAHQHCSRPNTHIMAPTSRLSNP